MISIPTEAIDEIMGVVQDIFDVVSADHLVYKRDGWVIYTSKVLTDADEAEMLAWLQDTFGRRHRGVMTGPLRFISNGGRWRFKHADNLDINNRISREFYMRDDVWTAFRLRWVC